MDQCLIQKTLRLYKRYHLIELAYVQYQYYSSNDMHAGFPIKAVICFNCNVQYLTSSANQHPNYSKT